MWSSFLYWIDEVSIDTWAQNRLDGSDPAAFPTDAHGRAILRLDRSQVAEIRPPRRLERVGCRA
jgi:hypothetical protein